MSSLEQQARDMLADMGIDDAQQMTAGDLVPLANVLSENARLRAALAAAPRWVSVTERLPDTQETLTVKLDNGHFGYGMYNGAAWVPFNDWRRTVTHWLELPPAPEVTR